MKQIMKLLAAILLLSTLTISCSKDDKDDIAKTKNHFKVGDTEYELSAGFLEDFGTSDWYKGYNTSLMLYSKGLKLLIDKDGNYKFDGKGDQIGFYMYSTTGVALDNRDYYFSDTEPTPIGTFDEGGYLINIDYKNETMGDRDDFAGGRVNVSKSGDEYTITIDCISDKGVKVSGFYKGKLQYFKGDKLK